MKKKIAALVVLMVLVGCSPEQEDPRLTEIAQCLTEKGVVMYGAIWCSHCKNQKKRFGPSFEYITYIECDPKTDIESAKRCVEDDIKGFPTWDLGGGLRISGNQNPEVLAEKAGC